MDAGSWQTSLQLNTDLGSAAIQGSGVQGSAEGSCSDCSQQGVLSKLGWHNVILPLLRDAELDSSHPFCLSNISKVLQQVIAYTFKEMENTAFC